MSTIFLVDQPIVLLSQKFQWHKVQRYWNAKLIAVKAYIHSSINPRKLKSQASRGRGINNTHASVDGESLEDGRRPGPVQIAPRQAELAELLEALGAAADP